MNRSVEFQKQNIICDRNDNCDYYVRLDFKWLGQFKDLCPFACTSRDILNFEN